MVRKWVMLTLLVFAGSLAASAWGDEIGDLRKELENQYNQLMQMQNKLMELESAQQQQAKQIGTLSPGGEFKMPETLAWIEKVKLYGDFRYRFEKIDAERDGVDGIDRDRQRIRVRLGLQSRINDEMTFDLRLASGGWLSGSSGDFKLGGAPTSANETLDSYFSSKSFWLDQAYLTYQPNWADDLKVLAGKMANPFYRVGKNQLIWDGDVNPEGVAVQYGLNIAPADELFFNGGMMTADEIGSDDNVYLWGAQGGLAHTFDDSSKLIAGVSYYDYMNIEGATPPGSPVGAGFSGNTLAGNKYAYDYNITELFGEYSSKMGDTPFALFGNWISNCASGVEADTGWLAGVLVNKTKEVGDWSFLYSYRELEADATLGFLSDGDFNGTTGRGHNFSINYMMAKNTVLGLNYYCVNNHDVNANALDDDFQLVQFDVVVKF